MGGTIAFFKTYTTDEDSQYIDVDEESYLSISYSTWSDFIDFLEIQIKKNIGKDVYNLFPRQYSEGFDLNILKRIDELVEGLESIMNSRILDKEDYNHYLITEMLKRIKQGYYVIYEN